MPFTEHSQLAVPGDSETLWHYLNFDKLLNMLVQKTITFRAIRNFEDKSEGKFPASVLKQFNNLPDWLSEQRIKKGLDTAEKTSVDSTMKSLKIMIDNFSYCVFAHCWFRQEHESILMWKSYAPSTSSCSIKSSLSRMKLAFNNLIDTEVEDHSQARIYGSLVDYIDYENEDSIETFGLGQLFHFVTHKRIEYKHENEFRLIYDDITGGRKVGINNSNARLQCRDIVHLKCPSIQDLVEEIVVSPYSVPNYEVYLKEVFNNAGIPLKIRRSSIKI